MKYVLLLAVCGWLLATAPAEARVCRYHCGPRMTTIAVQVAASGDDVNWSSDLALFSAIANNITVGNVLGRVRNGAARFNNVGIPVGATITAATVSGTRGSTSGSPLGKIYGDLEADPAAITSAADGEGRALTTAAVDWDSPGAGAITSPDISAIIQELIGQGGWASGNDLQIIFKDDGSAAGAFYELRTFDFDPALALTLNVTYTAGVTVAASGGSPHHFHTLDLMRPLPTHRRWD